MTPQQWPTPAGGDAACWAHEFALDRDDVRTRDDVRRLVVAFYRAVAMDDVLGPIFESSVADWNAHHDKLTAFWSWQLLGQARDEMNPLRAHEPVHARTPFAPRHYERWLELFTATVDELFAGPTADQAKAHAQRVARAFHNRLEGRPDPADTLSAPLALAVTRVDPSELT